MQIYSRDMLSGTKSQNKKVVFVLIVQLFLQIVESRKNNKIIFLLFCL